MKVVVVGLSRTYLVCNDVGVDNFQFEGQNYLRIKGTAMGTKPKWPHLIYVNL